MSNDQSEREAHLVCNNPEPHPPHKACAGRTEPKQAPPQRKARFLPPVPAQTVWRHKKRGTTYTELGVATFQCATEPAEEGHGLVVYRGDDGELWARRHSEFHDGRFEQVAATAPAERPDAGPWRAADGQDLRRALVDMLRDRGIKPIAAMNFADELDANGWALVEVAASGQTVCVPAGGDERMKGLVDRFLRWPLPDSVRCDEVAMIQGRPHRIGTNLLTANEAQAMLEFVLQPEPKP